MVPASRSDIVGEMIRGDLAGSRAVFAFDVRPREGRPVVQVWPGRRIGAGRVGDAITRVGKADRCSSRSQTARSSAEGGVMPADPPPGCGRAARWFERTGGAGEGVDRDQAAKRTRRLWR